VVTDSREARRRRQQLAGDNRTAVWARRRNRDERLHVLRASWRACTGMLVVAGVLITVVAFLFQSPFVRGMFVGTSITAVIGTIAYFVLALSGTVAPGIGAMAETWSASELRRLTKHGWLVINGVPLEGRDLDHVLIGPGGVIAIESKWSAYGWRLHPPDDQVEAAIGQATANARSLRLWEAVKASGAPVASAVLLWGGTRATTPDRPSEPVCLPDQTVVAYGFVAVRAWIDSLVSSTGVAFDPAAAETVWRALDHLVAERERVDPSAAPPKSVDRMFWTAMAALVMFFAAVVSSVALYTVSRSWWIWAVGNLALAGMARVLARWRPARGAAVAGLAGLGVGVIFAVVIGFIALLI
jgi:hypothetical protein